MINYILTGKTLTVILNGIPEIIHNSHASFEAVKTAIKEGRDEFYIKKLLDVKTAVENYSKGLIQITGDRVYYKEIEIKNALTDRLISMMKEGFNVNSMVLFIENLYSNPSKTAVDELYLFLEACNLPITEDGHFLAYKKVRSDYKDIHSGTFDNSIGQKPSMDRNMVDDNRNNTCSQGLHFASYSYMSSFGNSTTDKIMILKINPADVVSIPSDYNNAKGRCWQYEVVGEVPNDGKTQIKNDCIKDEEYKPSKPVIEKSTVKGTHPFKEVKQSISKMLYSNKIRPEDLSVMLDNYNIKIPDFKNYNELATYIRDEAYKIKDRFNRIDLEIIEWLEDNQLQVINNPIAAQDEKTKDEALIKLIHNKLDRELVKIGIVKALYSKEFKIVDLLNAIAIQNYDMADELANELNSKDYNFNQTGNLLLDISVKYKNIDFKKIKEDCYNFKLLDKLDEDETDVEDIEDIEDNDDNDDNDIVIKTKEEFLVSMNQSCKNNSKSTFVASEIYENTIRAQKMGITAEILGNIVNSALIKKLNDTDVNTFIELISATMLISDDMAAQNATELYVSGIINEYIYLNGIRAFINNVNQTRPVKTVNKDLSLESRGLAEKAIESIKKGRNKISDFVNYVNIPNDVLIYNDYHSLKGLFVNQIKDNETLQKIKNIIR